MTTIADFIEARLVEDEQDAERARAAADRPYVGDGVLWVVTGTDNAVGVFYDPDRVLRQVERDRKVLNRHRKEQMPPGMLMIGGGGDTCDGCGMRNGARAWPCAEVRDLAAIWSDHSDYREEWTT